MAAKAKTLFVVSDNLATRIAEAYPQQSDISLENIYIIPHREGYQESVREQILKFAPNKNVKLVPCNTAVYPTSRFFNRHTLDNSAKIKEAGFTESLVSKQLGISLATNTVSVINATNGTTFDPEKGLNNQKELLICGAPVSEIRAEQESLLDQCIFPNRLELGTLSTVGALLDYARFSEIKKPVLYLEIGPKLSYLQILTAEKVDIGRSLGLGLDSALPVLVSQLGAKDEDAARNLLYSSTFDLTEMGTSLLNKLLREIRATTAFYEVQTGQSIGSVKVNMLPQGMDWVRRSIERDLGIGRMDMDMVPWLEARGVKIKESAMNDATRECNLGLISLMIKHQAQTAA